MQEINIIIKNNIYYSIIRQNFFPYRPEEAVLLDSESLSVDLKI